jgi:hypothetical protein
MWIQLQNIKTLSLDSGHEKMDNMSKRYCTSDIQMFGQPWLLRLGLADGEHCLSALKTTTTAVRCSNRNPPKMQCKKLNWEWMWTAEQMYSRYNQERLNLGPPPPPQDTCWMCWGRLPTQQEEKRCCVTENTLFKWLLVSGWPMTHTHWLSDENVV